MKALAAIGLLLLKRIWIDVEILLDYQTYDLYHSFPFVQH